jgi:hypothetical protein
MVPAGSLEVVAMDRITFDQFLRRTRIFERTPVPINPGLRRGAWFSWPAIIACTLVFHYLPDGDIMRNSLYYYWTKGWMANTWNFVAAHRPIPIVTNLAMLGLAVILLLLTRAYQRAEIALQVTLFIPVVYAGISLLCALILLLPCLANLFVWTLMIALALSLCAILIGFMVRRAFR